MNLALVAEPRVALGLGDNESPRLAVASSRINGVAAGKTFALSTARDDLQPYDLY
jgi:hypothetical protein